MGGEDDPGYDRVTDHARKFEDEDGQVFSGPGRGPTPAEAAAAERAAPVSERTRSAYREMLDRGGRQRGEGRI
jgi:hypothetical protein